MGTEDNGDMGFQHRGSSSGMNPISVSGKILGRAMSSGAIIKSTNGADPFFGSGWDSLSMSQSENFGGSSMVPLTDVANPPFPLLLTNQAIDSSSHLVHYPSDLGLVDMVPKLPSFGSGNFSEMVSSFGLPESGQITNSGCPINYLRNREGGTANTSTNNADCQENCQVSEEGSSPNGRRKRRASNSPSPMNTNKNAEREQHKESSKDSSECLKEQEEKKQKIEQNISANLRGKQTSKQAKDNSNSGEAPKENYIHVRAKRGQATNSHSLAERVRRERISERMRLLQELVPGCNKITGKAVMLDEIINYVQSLQQQVEFLSMKLATVNPELNDDIERILTKDILHSRGSNAAIFGFGPGLSSSYPFPQGIPQGTSLSIPFTTPPLNPMAQVASRCHYPAPSLSSFED
ncbi:unnamed protein product [Ilex paraguariensis]|uniref:BHLH domain-containing protein n=1 Tax=Ilex paraguariensis TaxID=185542 RepID=A0ABC8U727_9AQUA